VTVPPAARAAAERAADVTWVGRVQAGTGLRLWESGQERQLSGFEHRW
jgi:hypothetical protein